MSYQLVFSSIHEDGERDIGENVFLDQLPSDYQVYMFYYPSIGGDYTELVEKLRSLGEITGKNLFVNVGKLNDPKFKDVRRLFEVKDLPVVIVTATADLASVSGQPVTAYVKIDSKNLLNSPDIAIQCLERVFNLFIGGEISRAIAQVSADQRNMVLDRLKDVTVSALKGIRDYVAGRDITISVIEGKFEIKRSGG